MITNENEEDDNGGEDRIEDDGYINGIFHCTDHTLHFNPCQLLIIIKIIVETSRRQILIYQ